MEKVDILIIGAGVIGLAVARELAMQGHEVVVCEKEKIFGSGVSSRNSGVIHAGIYYPQNSLKAQFCVTGRQKLYRYATEKGVPHKNCGKLIVSSNQQENETLHALYKKAIDNGVTDVKFVSREEAIEMEPELECITALYSPSSGIIDVHTLMENFIHEIESNKGHVAYHNEIEQIRVSSGFEVIFTNGERIAAKKLINAAGLNAVNVARAIDKLPASTIPKLYRAKGNYFSVSGTSPFSRLIYPVPVQGGLGAHFTMNIAGESIFGPDVEWLNDEDKNNYEVNIQRKDSFYSSIEKYWPRVREKELNPAYSGIRPKLKGPNTGDADFMIQSSVDHGLENLINLYGIESPGLTSCMAIADFVANKIG